MPPIQGSTTIHTYIGYIHTCMHARTQTHTHTYTRTHTRTHTHTLTHTHTHTESDFVNLVFSAKKAETRLIKMNIKIDFEKINENKYTYCKIG